jgi:hypothetical protein
MLDYKKIKEKSDKYYYDNLKQYNNLENEEVVKSKLYNFVVNLGNQMLFDKSYTFKEEDFDFMGLYNLDLNELFRYFKYEFE